jgi:hypothetical protein
MTNGVLDFIAREVGRLRVLKKVEGFHAGS